MTKATKSTMTHFLLELNLSSYSLPHSLR